MIVNRFAGLSVLNFLKSVKSKHKLNRNPDNPIHKSDLIQAEETLERLIEQFRSLRKELKPEEVPQEEKIRIILEKLNGDVQRIAEELIQHQKNFHLIDMYVQSQQQAMVQLKIKLTNFKKLDILIGRLNFASKFGPLKVITLTKNLQEED